MREYETLIIFKAAGTEQELNSRAAQIGEQIKKLGGSVEASQSIGRRKLAFPIARQVEGHYHFVRFRAPTDQVKELGRFFRLNDDIVRFIILTRDEVGTESPVNLAASRG